LLPEVYRIFSDTQFIQSYPQVFASVFALLPVLAGFLGGVQYPLAVALISGSQPGQKSGKAEQSAGFLYGMDVLGAALGALFTGAFLIPLWGIKGVSYLCGAINFAVLILLLLSSKRRSATAGYPAR